jgi:hypothetical protein
MVTLLCLQLHHVRGGSTPPSKLGREWEAGGELMKKSLRETKKKNKVMWKNFSRPNWGGKGVLGPSFGSLAKTGDEIKSQ